MTKGEAINWIINLTADIGKVEHQGLWHYEQALDEIRDLIEELPSAQPEIIHCKDCKNSEHWYRDRRRCFIWAEEGVSVFDDGFCNYAERRQDALN